MNFTFRTSPPAGYLSPTAEEMREVASKVGLGSYSRDLVADLAHLAAGGTINPPSKYAREISNRIADSLPNPDSSGEWKLSTGGYTKDRQTAIADGTKKTMKYHQSVCDFLQTVDLQKFSGNTPLEQAMSMLKLLSKQKGGSGGGESGEPLPIFQDNDNPEAVAKDLHKLMDLVENLDGGEKAMVDPDDENLDQSGEFQSELSKLKIAEDLTEGSQKRIMIDISRMLEQFTRLQVCKREFVEVDPEGEETQQRPIQSLAELGRIPSGEWALYRKAKSLFMYKAITNQMNVAERVTRKEKKQAIFILVDGSGSMHGSRHHKATGVVMNRLKAVLSGDAEVFISVFDTSMSQPDKASNHEEATTLIKKFANGNYRGGGTDIAAAVKAAHKYMSELIENGELLYKPDIIVLTDEDSSASRVKSTDIPGTRIHGFAMENKNSELKRLALSTGGLCFEDF